MNDVNTIADLADKLFPIPDIEELEREAAALSHVLVMAKVCVSVAESELQIAQKNLTEVQAQHDELYAKLVNAKIRTRERERREKEEQCHEVKAAK